MSRCLIVALIGLLSISVASFAADSFPQSDVETVQYRNSVDVGFNPGGLSALKLVVRNKLVKLEDLLPLAELLLGAEVTDLHSFGTYSFNYMRRVNDWLWLGGNVNYELIFLETTDFFFEEKSSYSIGAVPIMAMGKAAWLRRDHVSLYSKVGVGVTAVTLLGQNVKFKPAVQLTPIGVEFGGGHIFGFVEEGLGLQGVLIAGLRFMF